MEARSPNERMNADKSHSTSKTSDTSKTSETTVITSENNTPDKIYNIAIVGAGIAGMGIAALASQAGATALFEQHGKTGTESTAEQHCWGQFGGLYANQLNPDVIEGCIKNIQYLLKYFPMAGNNLRIINGQLVSIKPNDTLSWYRNEHIFYYYADDPNDPKYNLSEREKKEWQERVENAFLRTRILRDYKWQQSAHDSTPSEVLDSKNEEETRLFPLRPATEEEKAQRDIDGQLIMDELAKNPKLFVKTKTQIERHDIKLSTPYVIESHDRPMRSKRIMQSLYTRFKKNGGETFLNTGIVDHKIIDNGKDGKIVELISKDGRKFYAKKVVFTTGNNLHNLKGVKVKTVKSPLLIVTPPVCNQHAVYLTPSQKFTINHLHHQDYKSGKSYSIIGNGDAIDPEKYDPNKPESKETQVKKALEQSKENLLLQATEVFPKIKDIPPSQIEQYFGLKTEFTTGERNYHHALIALDEEGNEDEIVKAAVPGKFTFFPLLSVDVYRDFEGVEPSIPPYDRDEEEAYIKETKLRFNINGELEDTERPGKGPDELDTTGLEPSRNESTSSVVSEVGDTLHGQIVGQRVYCDGRREASRYARNFLVVKKESVDQETDESFQDIPNEEDTDRNQTSQYSLTQDEAPENELEESVDIDSTTNPKKLHRTEVFFIKENVSQEEYFSMLKQEENNPNQTANDDDYDYTFDTDSSADEAENSNEQETHNENITASHAISNAKFKDGIHKDKKNLLRFFKHTSRNDAEIITKESKSSRCVVS